MGFRYKILRKAKGPTLPVAALDLSDDITRLNAIIHLLDQLVSVDASALQVDCKEFQRELEQKLRREYLSQP